MAITVFLPPASLPSMCLSRVAAELRQLGHDVTTVRLAGRFPNPDQAAIYAVRSAWSEQDNHAAKLVAGTVMAAFDGLPLARVTLWLERPPEVDTAVLQQACRIIVPSEWLADHLGRACRVQQDRIRVIAPGIDDLPRNAGLPEPTCRILSVGDVIPRKGHDVLLRALGRLRDLDWRLSIAGAQPDSEWSATLHGLAEELSIAERLHFTAVPSWQEADVFALASHQEGYGRGIAEALRRGVPVAVTQVGAVPTLVAPEAGVICADGDVEQLSKAIRRLIFDRPLRQMMAETAWQSGQALPSWTAQATLLAAELADAGQRDHTADIDNHHAGDHQVGDQQAGDHPMNDHTVGGHEAGGS